MHKNHGLQRLPGSEGLHCRKTLLDPQTCKSLDFYEHWTAVYMDTHFIIRKQPTYPSLEKCIYSLYVLFVFGMKDKKKVACRHDWHQTGNQVVVTIYAKNSSPEHSYVEANRTVVSSDEPVTSSLKNMNESVSVHQFMFLSFPSICS